MRRKLIINADGFGFTHGINKGILESIEKGVVSSISCNVNFPPITDIGKIKDLYPDISIGLHLNLSVGKPVCDPKEIPTLVNESGEFWGHSLANRILSGKIRSSDIYKECDAQILKLQGLGVKISHLDGHRNMHLLPRFFKIVLELGKKYGIMRIRCQTRYVFTQNSQYRKLKIFGFYIRRSRILLNHIYNYLRMLQAKKRGFIMADRMISHGYLDGTEKYRIDSWLSIIRMLPPGINEIYCHPGYPCDELRKYSNYLDERIDEIKALTSDELKECIFDQKIEIISFNQL